MSMNGTYRSKSELIGASWSVFLVVTVTTTKPNQADCVEIYRQGNKPGQLVGEEGVSVRQIPRFNERWYVLAMNSDRLTFETSRFSCARVLSRTYI